MTSVNQLTAGSWLKSQRNGLHHGSALPRRSSRVPGRVHGTPKVRAISEKERAVEQFTRLANEAASTFRTAAFQTERALQGLSNKQMLQRQTELTAAELRAQAEQLRLQALQASSRLTGIIGRTEEERSALLRRGSASAQALVTVAGQLRNQVLTASSSASSSLSVLLQEAAKKKGVLLEAAKDAPGPIREIAETAVTAHSEERAKKGAVIHDFCLGISYGGILVLGGLLWFVLTGSVNAIRFGVILGGGILAAAVGSMKAWQKGKSSNPYIAVQGALSYVLFARELARYSQTQAVFPTAMVAISSIAMVAFYVYVVLAGGNPPSRKRVVSG